MAKPITIPNTFASATSAIPLSQLDQDFSTLANATNDLATYSNYVADTGAADAYIANFPANTNTASLTAGLTVQFKAANANTGASTLNVQVNGSTIGTAAIRYANGSALAAGAIAAGAMVSVMYDGTNFQLINDPAGQSGGDVTGPASATDNAIARFDGTSGKLIQNSVVTIADTTGDMSGVGTLSAGNVTVSGTANAATLIVTGNSTLGDASGDTLTITGTTVTTPNGLNFDNNTLVIDAASNRVGVNNATPTTALDVTGTATISTNLAFTGTGNRITGDFSNATIANRVMFQTSTTNGNTQVAVIPNGTSNVSTLQIYNTNDPANSSRGIFGTLAAEVRLTSDATGTGTNLPLTMYTGGSERLRIDTSGNLLLGTTTSPTTTNAAGSLSLAGYGIYGFSQSGSANTTQNSGIVFQNTNLNSTGAGQVFLYGGSFLPQMSHDATSGTAAIVPRGIFSFPQVTSSAATSVLNIASITANAQRYSSTDISSAAGNSLNGININYGHLSTLSSSAVTNTSYGIISAFSLLSGSITDARGFSNSGAINPTTGSVSITNRYGLFDGVSLGASTGTATITNYYGLYLNTPNVGANGTITNRWGIFQADTAGANYFAGNIGIGTSTPSVKLEINRGSAGSIATFTDGVSTNFNFSTSGTVGTFGTDAGSTSLALKSSGVERMRIDSSGNVLVGDTSSGSGAQFHVTVPTATNPPIGWISNSNAAYPTSSFGGALGMNFTAGGGEVDVWNNYPTAAYSFDFYQKTGTSAASRVLRINPNGTLNLLGASVTSGIGIAFPATQSASSDANTLDDYEEGTFTATVIGTSTAGTATYTTQNARYTKIGRLVQYEIYLNWNSGTGSGSMKIAGLPFTSANSSTFPATAIGYLNNITLTANYVAAAYVDNNSTNINLEQYPLSGGTQTSVNYDAAGGIILGGSYSV